MIALSPQDARPVRNRLLAALPQARADALLVMEDALVLSTSLSGRIVDLAATSRLSAMSG
jgi:hypothetical protein